MNQPESVESDRKYNIKIEVISEQYVCSSLSIFYVRLPTGRSSLLPAHRTLVWEFSSFFGFIILLFLCSLVAAAAVSSVFCSITSVLCSFWPSSSGYRCRCWLLLWWPDATCWVMARIILVFASRCLLFGSISRVIGVFVIIIGIPNLHITMIITEILDSDTVLMFLKLMDHKWLFRQFDTICNFGILY